MSLLLLFNQFETSEEKLLINQSIENPQELWSEGRRFTSLNPVSDSSRGSQSMNPGSSSVRVLIRRVKGDIIEQEAPVSNAPVNFPSVRIGNPVRRIIRRIRGD